jgi:hypothetical protein
VSADGYSTSEWVTSTATGGSSSPDTIVEEGHPGIYQQTISSNGGRHAIYLGNVMAQGSSFEAEFLIKLVTLATAAQDYVYRIGFMDNTAEYNRSVSANWRILTARTSTTTGVTTTVAATIAEWVKLKIVKNIQNTNAEFFINGVSVGSIATNIPTTAPIRCPAIKLVKTAGNTATNFRIDYVDLRVEMAER